MMEENNGRFEASRQIACGCALGKMNPADRFFALDDCTDFVA
jgi:hypothetical protein